MLLLLLLLISLLLLDLIPGIIMFPNGVEEEEEDDDDDDDSACRRRFRFRRRMSPSFGVRFLSIRRGCRGGGSDWGAINKAESLLYILLLLLLDVNTADVDSVADVGVGIDEDSGDAANLVDGTDKAWVLLINEVDKQQQAMIPIAAITTTFIM